MAYVSSPALSPGLLALALLAACAGSPGADGTASGSSTGADTTGADSTADPVDTGTTGATTEASSSDGGDTSGSTGEPSACATVLGSGTEPIFERAAGVFTLRDVLGYVYVAGAVREAPRPDFHQEAERSGMCRLLTFTAGVCDPVCKPPGVCIDGACVQESTLLSAGTATLAGVGEASFEIPKDPFNNYFWDSVDGPALSMLTLAASGEDIPAFELSVCPVDAPAPVDDWSAQLQARAPGEDVTLTWSNPIDTARIYLRMTTGIGTHGGVSPVEVECEGPDLGALTLPGAYLDALYADGWSCGECGGNDLLRYHADQLAQGDQLVQFRAESLASFWHIP